MFVCVGGGLSGLGSPFLHVFSFGSVCLFDHGGLETGQPPAVSISLVSQRTNQHIWEIRLALGRNLPAVGTEMLEGIMPLSPSTWEGSSPQ